MTCRKKDDTEYPHFIDADGFYEVYKDSYGCIRIRLHWDKLPPMAHSDSGDIS